MRSAHCGKADHHASTTFIGVNEHGWIFYCAKCSGPFVADPPKRKAAPRD